jgi:crotonobetainyl-CoA:carnitine CoA-transferase CaiB-like acyl-CoA transferase/acyl dehydratase
MQRYSVLAGVRVIEVGQVVAAPHCGLLLAAAGADVIKVERPPAGDDTRQNPGFYPSGMSAYFAQQNWGKRSIVLDLAAEPGKSAFRGLLAGADVLIENLRPGAMTRLGFGWPQVSAVNPALVMCSISAFGQNGPDAGRPGYGALAEARAGLYEMTGEPGGPPMSGQIPVADMMAASRAFGMICAALVGRARTGRGDYLDVSLLDCAVELQDWAPERFTASDGRDRPTRRGRYDDALVPWGQFATSDGWIVLIVSSDRFWPGLAGLLGDPGLAQRPELAEAAARREHRDEIYAAVERWAAGLSCDAALARLRAAGVPADRVSTIADVVADPQLQARGMFATLPSAAGRPVLGPALRFASDARPARDAPALGQHTAEVLAEIGTGTGGRGPAEASFTKTLSDTDLILFSGLSGDQHPVHTDETSDAARAAGGRTIHAMFLLGLMSTAASRLMQRRGLRTRFGGVRGVRFYAAARPGDTVRATARLASRGPGGALTVAISATTHEGTLLADGMAELESS